MSGVEVVQVIASVSELVRLSYNLYQFFQRFKKADVNAKDSYKRIKQLNDVVLGVQLVLERRKEQTKGKASARQDEQRVYRYINTSIRRCRDILVRIFRLYASADPENETSFFDRIARQIRFEIVRKEDLVEQYSALSTQLSALQLNEQTLQTFISIDTNELVESSSQEILDAIARLYVLHQKGQLKLDALIQSRENVPLQVPTHLQPPSIAVNPGHPSEDHIWLPDTNTSNDIEEMQSTLSAAMEIITNYDPSGQSVIDHMDAMNLNNDDSGFESDENDANEVEPATPSTQRVQDRPPTSTSNSDARVKHIRMTPQIVLDRNIAKYQERVQRALDRDQIQTAEDDLRQWIKNAEERRTKYGVSYDKTHMTELLATIYKKQNKHEDAIRMLEQLLPSPDSVEELSLANSKHFQMIATMMYELWTSTDKREHLDEAEEYAQSAFAIRYEKADEEDSGFQETAMLIADIYEAQNMPVEADTYRKLAGPAPTSPAPISPRPSSISLSADDGEVEEPEETTINANKALIKAIQQRDVKQVRMLLQRQDIDLEYRRKSSHTPLMWAFQHARGDKTIPLALIERGYNINAVDSRGQTALHHVALRADAAMLHFAIHKDASKDVKDVEKLTPLVLAVKEGYRHHDCGATVEAISVLIDEGCDFRAKDKDGYTAMHYAAHNAVTYRNAKSKSTRSAVVRILDLLLEKLPPNALELKDKIGYTPLIRIAGLGEPATVETLLKKDANANARNNAKQTPLYLAMQNKPYTPQYTEVIRLLVRYGATVDPDEHSREDFGKFKQILLNSNNVAAAPRVRKPSEASSRRESKTSVHQVERMSISRSSLTSSSFSAIPEIPASPTTANMKKVRKSPFKGLGLFGKGTK